MSSGKKAAGLQTAVVQLGNLKQIQKFFRERDMKDFCEFGVSVYLICHLSI